MSEVLTPEQAAVKLQVSRWTIYRWMREGKLPGRKLGRFWRIPEDALMETLQEEPESNESTAEYDEEPLSAGDWEAIRRGLEDVKAGRYVRWEDLRKELDS